MKIIIKCVLIITILVNISACSNAKNLEIHNRLSDQYWRKGDYASSERELKKVLKYKFESGDSEPYVTYTKLAHVLSRQGKINEAETYCHKSISIIENRLGSDSIEANEPKLVLVEILRKQKKYTEAEEVALKIIKIAKEKATKKEFIASPLNALGFVYKEQGKYTEAEQAYKEALQLNEESLGKQSFNYAVSLNNLGSLYAAKGEYPKSIEYLENSIKTYAATVGLNHPSAQGAKLNLEMQKMKVGRINN